ncbi:MAG: type II secretion system protein [Clostridiaceae bacterium]
MLNKKKKGFTLIELMIVLAIIAILAVVLIPKAGTMKDSAKSAGVSTNVNSVRAILETKVMNDKYLGDATETQAILNKTFTGENAIANPFTKDESVSAEVTVLTSDNENAIVVYDAVNGATTVNIPETIPTVTTTDGANEGVVFVMVYSDGFVVEGIDQNGDIVGQQIVK